MASFDTVNYSLRPSKAIQRQLVFEGVRSLQAHLDLERLVYVGFGSIWFSDFLMAHKLLGVDDMVSIEADDIGFQRAIFNSPYATVRVRHGNSFDVLPSLYADPIIGSRCAMSTGIPKYAAACPMSIRRSRGSPNAMDSVGFSTT